jgi:hypothetical protein
MKKIKAGQETADFIRLCYKANLPPLLWGAHGVGKSEMFARAAIDLRIGFLSRDLSLMEPPDLVGMPKMDGKTTLFLPPDFLPRSGEGIIVFEELNRCERYMRAPCLQLLTDRTLNDYRLPRGWLPAAAANPADVEYDVCDLDPALLSRFVQAVVVPDCDDWLVWARCNDIHPAVIDYISSDTTVFDHPDSNPRAWKYVSDLVRASDGKAGAKTLRAAVLGVVGDKRGAAFLRHLDGSKRPFSADKILSSYDEHGPTVRHWIKKGQLDLVKATLLAVKKELQAKNRIEAIKACERQWRNLARFLHDLPGDFHADAQAFFSDRGYAFPPRPRKLRNSA